MIKLPAANRKKLSAIFSLFIFAVFSKQFIAIKGREDSGFVSHVETYGYGQEQASVAPWLVGSWPETFSGMLFLTSHN